MTRNVSLEFYYKCINLFNPVPNPALRILKDEILVQGTVQQISGMTEVDITIVDVPIAITSVWTREDRSTIFHDVTNLSDITTRTSPYFSNITFSPLTFGDGGIYVYTVTVTALDSTYILQAKTNTSSSLIVQPYPNLTITKQITTEQVMQTIRVTLFGTVTVLNNTAPGYSLNYTWSREGGVSLGMFVMEDGGTLLVRDIYEGAGTYMLVVCLFIPRSGLEDHCSSTNYKVIPPGMI